MKYRVVNFAKDKFMVQKKVFGLFWKDIDSREFGYWEDFKSAKIYIDKLIYLKTKFKETVIYES